MMVGVAVFFLRWFIVPLLNHLIILFNPQFRESIRKMFCLNKSKATCVMMIPVAAHISEELQGMENSELNLNLGTVVAILQILFLDMWDITLKKNAIFQETEETSLGFGFLPKTKLEWIDDSPLERWPGKPGIHHSRWMPLLIGKASFRMDGGHCDLNMIYIDLSPGFWPFST